jgi:hypothetical protein
LCVLPHKFDIFSQKYWLKKRQIGSALGTATQMALNGKVPDKHKVQYGVCIAQVNHIKLRAWLFTMGEENKPLPE